MRVFLLVLDSVGIGAAPDAGRYGDEGANTLGHLAEAINGLHVPVLASLGLGNIPALLPHGLPIRGVPPAAVPRASYGAMQEMSMGKDTTTGHWELAGLELKEGFRTFPSEYPSFPEDLIRRFVERTGRAVLGNYAASGTQIIADLGVEQQRTGRWIVYTSADSVLQIAAHEDVIPLAELYRACEIARELGNPHRIGRIIARPFVGEPGHFVRTGNRRDYSYPLPEATLLDRLTEHGVTVTTVGKVDDIFAHRGITQSFHVKSTIEAQQVMNDLVIAQTKGLIFANFIDFDQLYGHRRDPRGYADALEQTDRFFESFLPKLRMDDILIITADHGNDPTFRGSDHTREFVPLLVVQPERTGLSLGIRQGFFDVAQSIAACFGLNPLPRGRSFLPGRRIET